MSTFFKKNIIIKRRFYSTESYLKSFKFIKYFIRNFYFIFQ